MKLVILLVPVFWAGCALEDQGKAPSAEHGASSSDPILMQAQAELETNTPPQEEKQPTEPETGESQKEESEPPQDRTGESDPNTGDDANPESVHPDGRY